MAGIEEKIAEWTHLPAENGEPIQILRYIDGQKYDAHWDWFDDPVHHQVSSEFTSQVSVFEYSHLTSTVDQGACSCMSLFATSCLFVTRRHHVAQEYLRDGNRYATVLLYLAGERVTVSETLSVTVFETTLNSRSPALEKQNLPPSMSMCMPLSLQRWRREGRLLCHWHRPSMSRPRSWTTPRRAPQRWGSRWEGGRRGNVFNLPGNKGTGRGGEDGPVQSPLCQTSGAAAQGRRASVLRHGHPGLRGGSGCATRQLPDAQGESTRALDEVSFGI